MKRILYIVPYFGKWPEWIELYFYSISKNPTIDFLFFTDCDISFEVSDNVRFEKISFEEYISLFKNALGNDIIVNSPYRICDLRPFFGFVHERYLHGYDFFGWTDVDIVYGNIRSFYTDELLDKFEIFSAHKNMLAGHSALLKNTRKYRRMGFKMYKWKENLQQPEYRFMDERQLYYTLIDTFLDKIFDKLKIQKNNILSNYLRKFKCRKYYHVEQYTTPFTVFEWLDGTTYDEHPANWFYENGLIFNERDKNRNFIYLHFMNFKSSKYRNGSKAPWEGKDIFYYVKDLNSKISINNKGIYNSEEFK